MPFRLLFDENVPGNAVEAARDAGHDVAWVRQLAPGSLDPEVLAWAQREHRVLLTFDKDFGELAVKRGAAAAAGVILFRITASPPDRVGRTVINALASQTDWSGKFAVVEDGRVRIRALATASTSE